MRVQLNQSVLGRPHSCPITTWVGLLIGRLAKQTNETGPHARITGNNGSGHIPFMLIGKEVDAKEGPIQSDPRRTLGPHVYSRKESSSQGGQFRPSRIIDDFELAPKMLKELMELASIRRPTLLGGRLYESNDDTGMGVEGLNDSYALVHNCTLLRRQ